MSDAQDILLTKRLGDDLVQLTMNRPPANALNHLLIERLVSVLQQFGQEAGPPGIILTGQGSRFFSAGGDIREVSGPELAVPRMRSFHAALCVLEQYPAPLVCAVQGYAVGGALELVLHSDYVIAGTNAQFGFPEINHGLLPAAKGMRLAAQMLGRRAAQSLLYSGALVTAERALELGIADEVVAPEDVQSRAQAVAKELRSKDVALFAAMKRSTALTAGMTDGQLETMTVDDMALWIERDEAAEARARFLRRDNGKS
jgi:enoyl-CoA hydratase/carnithine racemase